MHHERERLETFQPWPDTIWDTRILACSGCYSTYINDIPYLNCHFCNYSITHYPELEGEISQHRYFSPSCPLIQAQNTNNVPIDKDSFLSDILTPPPQYNPIKIAFPFSPTHLPHTYFHLLYLKDTLTPSKGHIEFKTLPI